MYGADFTPIILLIGFAVNLLILYFVIKGAVREGLKEHTRWQVANRAEIEATYGKKPDVPPTAPPAPPVPPRS